MNRLRLWFLTLGLGGLGALLTGELALRAWDHYQGVTPPYAHNPPETMARSNGYFNFDLEPDLKVTYKPRDQLVTFSINRWGFRSADYDPIRPEGTYRIFAFGGSSTFDPFVTDDETWVERTGRRLSERTGRRIEVINAGRYGYTTSEVLGLLQTRVSRHQPSLVILYSTFNDARAHVSPYWGRDDGPQLYGKPLLRFVSKRSALFTFVDWRLRNASPTKAVWARLFPADLEGRPAPKEHHVFVADHQRRISYLETWYRRNVLSFIASARVAGAEVALVSQIVNPADLKVEDARLTELLRSIARETGTLYVDLKGEAGSTPQQDGLLASYVHLNTTGTAFVAERLSRSLSQLLASPP